MTAFNMEVHAISFSYLFDDVKEQPRSRVFLKITMQVENGEHPEIKSLSEATLSTLVKQHQD